MSTRCYFREGATRKQKLTNAKVPPCPPVPGNSDSELALRGLFVVAVSGWRRLLLHVERRHEFDDPPWHNPRERNPREAEDAPERTEARRAVTPLVADFMPRGNLGDPLNSTGYLAL
eukprot:6187421-Pleurochrysis_carterae.AAC.2